MEAKGVFGMVSRESALVANNILLAVACFVVFVGTLWPLVAEMLWDRTLSVGPPFFDAAFSPFMIALLALLPIGSALAWKRAKPGRTMRGLWGALVLSLVLGALAYAVQSQTTILAPLGVVLGVWVLAGVAVDLASRTGRGSIGQRLGRLTRLPGADWGKSMAHGGLGITTLGICLMVAWQVEDIRVAQVGEPYTVGDYTVTLMDVRDVRGPNYFSTMATIEMARDGRVVATLSPEKRVYPVAQMPTTEAAIANGFLRDLYVVIGDPQANGGWAVRVYIKPFANWIWAGCIIMALGGMASLSDRRYRLAAGAREAKPVSAGVPAE
jgi:cytochrome c-type biogenesis protein CcmF